MNENTIKKWRFLVKHIPKGKENAIKGAELQNIIKKDERQFYKMISEARQDGIIICADHTGYYIPNSPDEMIAYHAITRSKALTILKTLSATRRKLKDCGIEVK